MCTFVGTLERLWDCPFSACVAPLVAICKWRFSSFLLALPNVVDRALPEGDRGGSCSCLPNLCHCGFLGAARQRWAFLGAGGGRGLPILLGPAGGIYGESGDVAGRDHLTRQPARTARDS